MPEALQAARMVAASPSSSSNRSRTHLDRWAPWIAAAAAVITFANSPNNEYCYDDVPIVQEGSRIHDEGKWREIWTTDYWYDLRTTSPYRDLLYRPLTLTSIRFIRAVAGDSPIAQRLANIALHALIAGLAVLLCQTLGLGSKTSLLSGVLFAVLPVHTEVVDAVVGRADLLATVFILLAIGSHDRSLRAKQTDRSMGWKALAAVAAFGAMSAKENGLAVIPLVILADIYRQRRDASSHAAPSWLCVATLHRIAYLAIPLGGYLSLRYLALDGRFSQNQSLTPTINALVGATTPHRLLGVLQLWGMYWAKTIWPATLNIKYTIQSVSVASQVTHPHVVIGAATMLAALGLTWHAWRRGRQAPAYLFVGLLICYFPTSNSIVLIQEFFAERLWYLPSLFAVAFLGAVAAPFLFKPRWKNLAIAGFVAVSIAMIARSWLRNMEWRNNATLYAAAYRDAPDSVGVLQLYGDWLTLHGRNNEGIELLRQALQIDPGYVDAHRSLAQAYLASNDPVAAAQHLEMVARLLPTATPYNNLGVSYARQGRLAEAEQMFQKALQDPNAASFAHYNLGVICHRSKRLDEAIVHWEESLRLDPHAGQTADDLGRLYISLHRTKDAARIFAHGTEQIPDNPRFWKFLAMTLATSQDDSVRDGPRAVLAAEKANALLDGSDASTLAVLASAHAETGAFGLAVVTAQRALALVNPETNAVLFDQLREQISLYKRGEPYRDPRF